MFFVGAAGGAAQTLLSTGLLLAVIVLGVVLTLLISRLLSHTMLKGVPSSFVLELPPYRRPQFGKVIARSLLDRTLFVLGRAVAVAAPAGALLFMLANVQAGDMTLLQHVTVFFDPFARAIGMDGVIMVAFILGFPANEIVVPIMIMAYLANGALVDVGSLDAMKNIFVQNGWTPLTAICTLLFTLVHFPCSTTCLTIYKETRSVKWTLLSALVPLCCGVALCAAVTGVWRLLGI